jgi:hypothetical protein
VKIVCVGCSWTDQLALGDYHTTYPYLLKQRHTQAEVYNLGIRGANNFLINMVLTSAIKSLNPDFVVRQVTSWNRWMWLPDRFQFDLRLAEMEPGYFHLDVESYAHDLVLWTAGSLAHPFQDITATQLHDREQRRIRHYDDMSLSLDFELEDSALYKTSALLNNIDHVMLFWRNNTSKLPSYNKWQQYPCVERDVGFSHSIDSGDHFGVEGNQAVIDQIIQPVLSRL